MKIVGLTGGIGSGKSTAANFLVNLGARLIDADLLAREVVEPGKPAHADIVGEFGEGILTGDGSIDRKALAAAVFNDEAKRKKLVAMTHPRIGQEMVERIAKYRGEGVQVVLIDAALLFESAATNWIKPVILVVADEEIRIDRVIGRDGAGRDEVIQRMRSQMPDEEKKKLADFIVDNSGDLASLEARVKEVWEEIVGQG